MAFGYLLKKMEDQIHHAVAEKTVYDLCAGDLTYSHLLLDLGASEVIAIDKEPRHRPRRGLAVHQAYLADMTPPRERYDVALVSWPVYSVHGLVRWLTTARVVVYLGSNVDGTACGNPTLFTHLLQRELLAYVPHRRNSLIVCGEYLDAARQPVGEEFGSINGQRVSFAEAEQETLKAIGAPELLASSGPKGILGTTAPSASPP